MKGARCIWLCALTIAALQASAGSGLGSPVLASRQVSEEPASPQGYDALLREFESALEAWTKSFRAAPRSDRARQQRLKAEHPAGAFEARFRALGEAGDGRGYLWCLRNLQELRPTAAERAKLRMEVAEILARTSAAEPWMGEVIPHLARDARRRGAEETRALLTTLAEPPATAEVRARSIAALLELTRSGSDTPEARALAERLRSAIAESAGSDWALEVLGSVVERMDLHGEEAVRSLVERVLGAEAERSPDALTSLAEAVDRTGDALREELAVAIYRRLQREHPGHRLARQAERRVFQIENLRVGRTAPDFEAVDVDGVAFKLSDYRGKVVVLDFWGFW